MRKALSTKVHDPDSYLARGEKKRALSVLLATCPGGEDALIAAESYLDACRFTSVAAFGAACESLRNSWTDTFTAPQPAHVRAAARRFTAQSSAEINRMLDAQRVDHVRCNQITAAIAQAELARVHEIPLPEDEFEARVEFKRREGLERYLAREEGEEPKPRRVFARGEDGFRSIGSVLEGVV